MGSFFDKAKSMGAKAADKAGDAVEIGKAKAKIASKKSDIEKVQVQIGEYCHKRYLGAGAEEDDTIRNFCMRIDELNKEVAELEAQIFATKNED